MHTKVPFRTHCLHLTFGVKKKEFHCLKEYHLDTLCFKYWCIKKWFLKNSQTSDFACMLVATECTSNEFKDAGVLTSKEGKRLIELFEISFSLTFHSTKKVFSTFEAATCLAVKFIQST